MRRHIKGRVYDTEKAEYLASDECSYDTILGCYCQDELYKKHNGTFFMHRHCYGVNPDGSRCSFPLKEDVFPVSIHSAISWVAEELSDEDYDRIFRTV